MSSSTSTSTITLSSAHRPGSTVSVLSKMPGVLAGAGERRCASTSSSAQLVPNEELHS